MSDSRVFFLTFYKCGSQWVRDVLADPEILAHSGGLTFGGGGLDADLGEIPEPAAGTFSGPLYDLSHAEWRRLAGPDDRAVVVLRDPRDVVVSWMFSVTYSHRENELFDRLRGPLLAMDRTQRLLFFSAWFGRLVRAFRSWGERAAGEREWITTYEALLEDQEGEFGRIFDFLGWPVPPEVLARVVRRHSFAERSGRQPGDENVHSHFRRAEPGDWRRHFDSVSGLFFERVTVGLVGLLGYEKDPEWYRALAEPEAVSDRAAAVEERRRHDLEARVARLAEENRMLTRTCEERLELIERLSAPTASGAESGGDGERGGP